MDRTHVSCHGLSQEALFIVHTVSYAGSARRSGMTAIAPDVPSQERELRWATRHGRFTFYDYSMGTGPLFVTALRVQARPSRCLVHLPAKARHASLRMAYRSTPTQNPDGSACPHVVCWRIPGRCFFLHLGKRYPPSRNITVHGLVVAACVHACVLVHCACTGSVSTSSAAKV